jgi:hypothetical protein
VMPVTGSTEVVVPAVPHTKGAVQAMRVVIVADPVGSAGVEALYVKLFVTVIVQLIVVPTALPALLHSEIPIAWALAWLTPPPITRPNADVKQKERAIPSEKTRIVDRRARLRVVTELLQSLRAGLQPGAAHAVQRSLQVATRHQLSRASTGSPPLRRHATTCPVALSQIDRHRARARPAYLGALRGDEAFQRFDNQRVVVLLG